MAVQTKMADNTFFGSADWPNIPMQNTDNTNMTGWTLAFYVYSPGTKTAIITATIANGGIVVVGAGTAITTGLFYVKVTKTMSSALTATLPNPTSYPWSLWRTDSGYENEMGYGTIPVRF